MERGEDYLKNIPRVLLMSGLWAFMIIMPIIVPFFEGRGLDMENIYQLQAIFGLGVLLLEVPSGYISDLLGRKRTLLVASVFHAIGFTLFAYSSGFGLLVVAELILAVGVSLYSGTDLSLIYDSLAAANTRKAPIKMVGRRVFYRQLGETMGGLVGGWCVLWSIEAAAVANAFVAWAPFFVVLTLKEPPRELMDKKKHRENWVHIYRSLFKHSALLNLIITNMVFYSLATLLAVWAFQKYWQELDIPLIYFGYLWAATNLVVGVVARYAHKIEKKWGSALTIALMAALPVIGYFGMASVEAIWGVVFCFSFQIARGINAVIMSDGLNKRVSGEMRATANSIASLGTRGLFIFMGPLIGYLIDQKSISFAFEVMGWFYLACFFLVMLPLLAQRKNYDPIK